MPDAKVECLFLVVITCTSGIVDGLKVEFWFGLTVKRTNVITIQKSKASHNLRSVGSTIIIIDSDNKFWYRFDYFLAFLMGGRRCSLSVEHQQIFILRFWGEVLWVLKREHWLFICLKNNNQFFASVEIIQRLWQCRIDCISTCMYVPSTSVGDPLQYFNGSSCAKFVLEDDVCSACSSYILFLGGRGRSDSARGIRLPKGVVYWKTQCE